MAAMKKKRHASLWRIAVALLFWGSLNTCVSFLILAIPDHSLGTNVETRRWSSTLEESAGFCRGDLGPSVSPIKSEEYLPLIQRIQESQIGSSEAFRVFHGRGGMFPGCEHLSLDWLPPVWLLTSFKELEPADLHTIQQSIESRSVGLDQPDIPLNFVYQFRSPTNATTAVLAGSIPDPHVVSENGMKFLVRLDRAKNHGIFLDMANGRDWVRQRAQDKVILNLFSYTCGFSVAALCGGADTVVNVDMVNGALKTGQRNHELNDLRKGGARFLAHDIFKSWGKIRKLGPYDIIVADPPSFQKNSFVAKKDYGKIIRRLPDLLVDDGFVMLCLNAPELNTKWFDDLVATEAPALKFVERLENPSSFGSEDDERGLKVMIYRLGKVDSHFSE